MFLEFDSWIFFRIVLTGLELNHAIFEAHSHLNPLILKNRLD
jgi:hypothetical protein